MILQNLSKGKLVKRYKRFFADIELDDGSIITAHCPNTGSMRSLISEDTYAWVSPANNPKRKLAWTLELLQGPDQTIACVNTQRANHQVAEALHNGWIQEFSSFTELKQEVPYGQEKSRIDIRLKEKQGQYSWIEIKNVTLKEENYALFPDAVTTRGQKHLRELIHMRQNGERAIIFFLVNRSGAACFTAAAHIDPDYAKLLEEAQKNGVEILVYQSSFEFQNNSVQIQLKKSIPLCNQI
jgi:sugar fermentation stimulation protein A